MQRNRAVLFSTACSSALLCSSAKIKLSVGFLPAFRALLLVPGNQSSHSHLVSSFVKSKTATLTVFQRSIVSSFNSCAVDAVLALSHVTCHHVSLFVKSKTATVTGFHRSIVSFFNSFAGLVLWARHSKNINNSSMSLSTEVFSKRRKAYSS